MKLMTFTGIYIQIILGPSEDETTRVLQFLGIAASLTSISKGTSDWWIRSKTNDFDWWVESKKKKLVEPTFLETIKSALFFTPHLIFRAVAMTMCAGFLGYYVICPTTIIIIIVLYNFVSLSTRKQKRTVIRPRF